MKQTTRELLVTTKVAQSWQDDFDRNVDELMKMVSKVDNVNCVEEATELLDVYHNTIKDTPSSIEQQSKQGKTDKPFEFVVFRN